jgi:hypothetical protein|eukprot:COSAG01_NODE_4136_length_5308_cov_65.001728_7_plen_35_part_00
MLVDSYASHAADILFMFDISVFVHAADTKTLDRI